MNQVLLTDFRCFAGTHTVPVRPLTLLVGENSSGKTSFLAAVRAATDVFSRAIVDFNEEPYLLGAYDELANYRGGKAGRAEEFRLGYAANLPGSKQDIRIVAAFKESHAQPFLKRIEVVFENGRAAVVEQISEQKWKYYVTQSDSIVGSISEIAFQPFGMIEVLVMELLGKKTDAKHFALTDVELKEVRNHIFRSNRYGVFAAAPIRAEPKRTYEITSDQPKSHGSHIPVLISQIYGKDGWAAIQEPLLSFAKDAGLFNNISVKRLGNKESGPFQIQVKIEGPSRNIIDVGYGVSQVLPLLVEVLRRRNGSMLLLQQPEVHLHPRAQAQLGTLLGGISKSDKKQIFVETHSDYIVDRVRMDVRDKKAITKDDVVILFFENTGKGTKIHPIFLDELGNLIDAPPTYRQFFLQEERRFLGF